MGWASASGVGWLDNPRDALIMQPTVVDLLIIDDTAREPTGGRAGRPKNDDKRGYRHLSRCRINAPGAASVAATVSTHW